MGATVENGAETPVGQELEVEALERERADDDGYEVAKVQPPDPPSGGEKVPQTYTLKITKLEIDGAPTDLWRGEYVYFEGVCKVTKASTEDKLDAETFVTVEAVKTVSAVMTDLRIGRGHGGPELDPDQQQLGV
jgi:hypothetical protein